MLCGLGASVLVVKKHVDIPKHSAMFFSFVSSKSKLLVDWIVSFGYLCCLNCHVPPWWEARMEASMKACIVFYWARAG